VLAYINIEVDIFMYIHTCNIQIYLSITRFTTGITRGVTILCIPSILTGTYTHTITLSTRSNCECNGSYELSVPRVQNNVQDHDQDQTQVKSYFTMVIL